MNAITPSTGGSSAKNKKATSLPASVGQVAGRVADTVTGLFGSSSETATGLLKKDHQTVADLFEKVKANEDGNNVETFKQIKAELDAHAHIEEKIFYPYLLKKGDKKLKDLVREGIEEHGQIKNFLAELAAIARDTPEFKAKLKVLIEDTEHHVQEEENEMFPMVNKQVSSETQQKMAKQLETEKLAFMSKLARTSPAAKRSLAAAKAQSGR